MHRVVAPIILLFLTACSATGSQYVASDASHVRYTLAVLPKQSQAPNDPRYIDYVFVPHPDDEMEGWTAFAIDANAYPVFAMMTRGEHSSFCSLSSYALGFQPQLGELPASPVPTSTGPICAQSRMNSFTAFMNDMASVDPQHDDVLNQAPLSETSAVPAPPNCTIPDPTFLLWIGAHNARIFFNLGNGSLKACEVPWVLASIEAIKSAFPVQHDMNAIGDGYYGTNAACPNHAYVQADHFAIYTALRTMHLGLPGVQLSVGCQTDSASVGYAVPLTIFNFMAPSRTGAIQRHYGWLTVNAVQNPPPNCCYSFQYVKEQWFFMMPSSVSPTPSPTASPLGSAPPSQKPSPTPKPSPRPGWSPTPRPTPTPPRISE